MPSNETSSLSPTESCVCVSLCMCVCVSLCAHMCVCIKEKERGRERLPDGSTVN